MCRCLKKRGQSTLEYAVLIVVIITALIAMQVYIKRGVQGRMRESADQIGDQFSPGITQSNYSSTSYAKQTSYEDAWGVRTEIANQFQNRYGFENVAEANQEYWGI